MYITSGKYKGRKILFVKNSRVRPVMSLIREAFFSIIFNYIKGSRFLDVFSGTGIMSLEALSRGASFAAIIEYNKNFKEVLKKNFSFIEEPYIFF